MKRIFILGAYGQNNLGDEALLQTFIEQFGASKIIVNSAQPALTARQYGVKTVTTYLSWPRFSRLRAMLGSDLIIFGGGSLLKETEGSTLGQLLYFARLFLLLLGARLLGRRTAMLGVGIGPLNHSFYKKLSRIAANLTDLICVRDNASAQLLRELGLTKPVHILADPVFLLGEGRSDGGATAAPNLPPFVAVVPRYSLTLPQQAALAKACDFLVETYGVRIIFIPFQTGYQARFDDLAAAKASQQRMRRSGASEIWTPATPEQALDLIGQARLVLSARLHALIFAAIKGVPSVALDYEVKVQNFMAEVGQSWACLDLGSLEQGKLPRLLVQVWERQAETKKEVGERLTALQALARRNFELIEEQPARSSLLATSALLLISVTIVNAGNYLFNLILGRWLGPAAFAELSLVVTLLLAVTFITSTLQTVTAKFVATLAVDNDLAQLAALRRWLVNWAWLLGGSLLLLFTLGAPLWMSFFQTTSVWPFILLGIGLPVYLVQGVERGVLQGQTRFGRLALSYQAEMWTRLACAVTLVAIGWAVAGAVVGLTLSFVATWLVARRARLGLPSATRLDPARRTQVLKFVGPVSASLIGQVIISNSDILIVKHFFEAAEAGHYAALALIGRIVFFATWSVVTMLIPLVAQKAHKGESHRQYLTLSLGLVGVISAIIMGVCFVMPNFIVEILFGKEYLSIAPLLWLYAAATAAYALGNVLVTYWLSAGKSGGSLLALLAGLAQVAGLWIFHASLLEVVLVQLYLMGALFGLLLIWDRWLAFAGLRKLKQQESIR